MKGWREGENKVFYMSANTPGNSSSSKQKGCFGLQTYNMLIQPAKIK